MPRPPRMPPPADAPSAKAAADHDLAPRLSFPLSRDKSKIAYNKLQDKTRAELRRVLSDPELSSQLGVSGVSGAPGAAPLSIGDDAFPPELCGVAFDAISMLIVALAKQKKIDRAELLVFTPEDKAILNPKAAKLLDKYAPGSLGTYHLEVEFTLALLGVIAGKLAILRAAASPAAATGSGPQLVRKESESEVSAAVNS